MNIRVRFWLWLLLIVAVCLYDGNDRWQLNKRVLALEWKADGIMLARDMAEYRKQHPFRRNDGKDISKKQKAGKAEIKRPTPPDATLQTGQ